MNNDQPTLNLKLPEPSELPVRRTIALPRDFWEAAKQLGNGNTTLGLKIALTATYKKQPTSGSEGTANERTIV